jgi:hypothetical protein
MRAGLSRRFMQEYRHPTMANRIVEITPDRMIDRVMGFEEYLEAG